jgi:hypothetical protein
MLKKFYVKEDYFTWKSSNARVVVNTASVEVSILMEQSCLSKVHNKQVAILCARVKKESMIVSVMSFELFRLTKKSIDASHPIISYCAQKHIE